MAPAPLPSIPPGVILSAEDLRTIAECERIVKFRDEVFAGTHPRVKLPHPVKQPPNIRKTSSPPSLPPPPTNGLPLAPQPASSPFSNDRSFSNSRSTPTGNVPMTYKSGINPILLEKSDDLIKAEMQLQRQRLERALRDQVEQQKLEAKALLQSSESLPNFDLTQVLSQALAIVHPGTVTVMEVEPSVGSASDSFDENTFYSSAHPTPEASPPRKQNEPVVEQMHTVSGVATNSIGSANSRGQAGANALLSNDRQLTASSNLQSQQAPSQQQIQTTKSDPRIGTSAGRDTYAENNRKDLSPLTVSTHRNNFLASTSKYSRLNINQPLAQAAALRPEFQKNDSPLIRAHNLSPFAPQPARVSPLVTARGPPVLREQYVVDEVTPAQVSALRQEPGGISSSNSSPRGGAGSGGSEKRKSRKEKRQKRKASFGAVDMPDLPYIKPEPRSPSPLAAVAPLPRPQKRQRQAGQYAAELNYDEPRYEPVEKVQERVSDRYKEAPSSGSYDRFEDRYELEPRRPQPIYERVGRDDVEYRHVSDAPIRRRPESPTMYTLPYPPDPRTIRAASRAVVDRRERVYEEPVYYREPVTRASVRPDADRERSRSPIMRERRSPPPMMPPPRRPIRIYVDEFGREYLEPPTAAPIRQSMAPPTRYRDSESLYERAPLRAVSGRAAVETYEEDGVLYRRASPILATPRRVVTQPEYEPEYRSYRQREYSVRPTAMGPPADDDYVQVRETPYMRAPSVRPEAVRYELPREYIRQQSARPEVAGESVRYEIPREYVSRQSVRPEAPPRAYSVRPESYRIAGEYARPLEAGVQHVPVREERYYDDVQRAGGEESRRPAGEIEYIERPRVREASVMVYADDARREYR